MPKKIIRSAHANISRTFHMAIARSLFRRLLATESDWRMVLENSDAYKTRADAIAAVDDLPAEVEFMPACDEALPNGKCPGHNKEVV